MMYIYRKNKKHVPLKASFTIEAALALPVFMFFAAAVIYLLIIISLQCDIQSAMEEAAGELTKKAYLTKQTDSDYAISYLTIRSAVFTDELKEEIEASAIKDGVSGVSSLFSEYDEETGILDIVLTYTYVIPFLSGDLANLEFVQRVRSRAWIGDDISGDEGASSEGEVVYITPSGSVYHLTMSCPYLDLSISQISFGDVSSARNASGSRYTACTSCCKSSTYETVYITEYGTNYHSSLSCSKLKRTIIAVDISEVGTRSECSKCAALKQSE